MQFQNRHISFLFCPTATEFPEKGPEDEKGPEFANVPPEVPDNPEVSGAAEIAEIAVNTEFNFLCLMSLWASAGLHNKGIRFNIC